AGEGMERDARPTLAADGRGDVAAAWTEEREAGRGSRIRIAARRPGRHAFGAAATVVVPAISSGRFADVHSPVLAYGPRGRLLLAYVTFRRVGSHVTRVLEVRTQERPG